MSWTNEKILNLIQQYEKRPILWQRNEKHYYNTAKKENAWRELSEMFDEDITVLKKKMESLRGSRRREKNRMASRKGRRSIYISKWFAWDALKFLEDPEEQKTTALNYSEEDDPIETVEVDLQPHSDEYIDEQVKKPKKTVKKSVNRAKKFGSSKRLAASRRTRSRNSSTKEACNISQSRLHMDMKTSDECTVFGEYIAVKLRKHDARTRMVLQHQIHELLFQAEMSMKPTMQRVQSRQRTELQNASTSLQSESARNDFSSPSSASSGTGSPLQSPRDNQTGPQP